jgi:hypothetical protein
VRFFSTAAEGFVAHPKLSLTQKSATAREFKMKDGQIVVTVRRALLFYLLDEMRLLSAVRSGRENMADGISVWVKNIEHVSLRTRPYGDRQIRYWPFFLADHRQLLGLALGFLPTRQPFLCGFFHDLAVWAGTSALGVIQQHRDSFAAFLPSRQKHRYRLGTGASFSLEG